MPRWIGLLGSWALLILALGLTTYAIAAETITFNDSRKLSRIEEIDRIISAKADAQIEALKKEMGQTQASVTNLETEVAATGKTIEELHDSSLVITVATAENKVYARRNGELVFEAICSTGKNTTLDVGGETKVFRTPIGKFRIIKKEENPKWVPPDWHYVEQAQKRGMGVIRLNRGDAIGGLYVSGNNVYRNGYPLPPGEEIYVGGAIVIPPVGTVQREHDKVLGTHRLNLGDGYALHGTQEVSKLGQNVSHGCVRLANEDIATLYQIANVGDEVVIY
jgi:lipoprotein-anchoring transpeptidase ErfK/SrfK